MAQSLSKVYVHITFSTKLRQPLIDDQIMNSLFDYVGGISKGIECNPIRIGGTNNHIHILCSLSRKIAQMKLVEEIKKQSSKWIKTKGDKYSDFYWQDGYGIFSVNPTQLEIVSNYIDTQMEHHKKTSFQDEFIKFLKKYKLVYNEQYLWD